MGTARAIGSIVLTGIGGGSRLLTRTWWALRKGRAEVRKSARTFYKTLREAGIPDEDARAIAVAYAQPAYDILRLRSLIRMAMEMSESDSSPSFST